MVDGRSARTLGPCPGASCSRCACDRSRGGLLATGVARCPDVGQAAGPRRLERTLYAQRQDGARALCPLALRAGISEGQWTPLAATHATWVVAHLTPQEGEEFVACPGNRTPSKSRLARLPRPLRTPWEPERSPCDAPLRQQEAVPPAAVTVAGSREGVRVPMQEGDRPAKRAQAMAQGQLPGGPAGYQEVGGAPVAYEDRERAPAAVPVAWPGGQRARHGPARSHARRQ